MKQFYPHRNNAEKNRLFLSPPYLNVGRLFTVVARLVAGIGKEEEHAMLKSRTTLVVVSSIYLLVWASYALASGLVVPA